MRQPKSSHKNANSDCCYTKLNKLYKIVLNNHTKSCVNKAIAFRKIPDYEKEIADIDKQINQLSQEIDNLCQE